MDTTNWVTLGAALLSGPLLERAGRLSLRLIRGDVDRQDKRVDQEIAREAAELKRLLDEIAQLRLDRQDKEALVDLLRRQLDHALVRNNASTTIARILLASVDSEVKPSRQMIAAREQARRHINATEEQMRWGS